LGWEVWQEAGNAWTEEDDIFDRGFHGFTRIEETGMRVDLLSVMIRKIRG
jgi:hypothetical protein